MKQLYPVLEVAIVDVLATQAFKGLPFMVNCSKKFAIVQYLNSKVLR